MRHFLSEYPGKTRNTFCNCDSIWNDSEWTIQLFIAHRAHIVLQNCI